MSLSQARGFRGVPSLPPCSPRAPPSRFPSWSSSDERATERALWGDALCPPYVSQIFLEGAVPSLVLRPLVTSHHTQKWPRPCPSPAPCCPFSHLAAPLPGPQPAVRRPSPARLSAGRPDVQLLQPGRGRVSSGAISGSALECSPGKVALRWVGANYRPARSPF